MFLNSNDPKECYGCKACSNVCPKEAISFQICKDTFSYPNINKKLCINCGACMRVCPFHEIELSEPRICFAAVSKNNEDWEHSSSGGAFKVLASVAWERCQLDKKDFFLCACDWDSSFNAVHKIERVTNISQIEQYCKSKYVQSNTNEVYRKIKSILMDPKNVVMFVGTPCQVSGLKKYLQGKVYNGNIIYIDLVCSGAPSQKIFDKYKAELEKKENSKIKKFIFKNKEKLDNGTIYTRSAKIEFENNHSKMVTRYTDDYLKMFYTMPYHSRPSCYTCKFKNKNRIGDITIGDAWNIDKIYPNLNPFHGISLLLFNSELGKAFIPYVKKEMDTYDCNYDFIVESNSGLRPRSGYTIPQKIIDNFFSGIMNDEKRFSECVEEYQAAINEYKLQNQ